MTEPARDGGRSSDGVLERRLARLITAADTLCAEDEQRRDPLMERAESKGLRRSRAEQVYDMAVEERVPPALAIAVVLEGISVRTLDSPRPDVGARESAEPGWVDAPPADDAAALERRLRSTFRRLRSLLEEAPTPAEAFKQLARAPDVEPYDY